MPRSLQLSALFEEEPFRWGLRGDPYLWRDMGRTLRAVALPQTEAQFVALIESTFEQLTGAPLSSTDYIYVEKYDHGGMSSGYVSPPFWRETALPLLRARYTAAEQSALRDT